MNIRFLRLGALVIASLGLVSNATAGGYVGASFGQGSVDFCSDARAIGATSCDDSDTGFKLFGGYDFTDNLGVELSYNNLGTVGAGALGLNIDVDASAIAVAARARMAVGDKFGLFGKLGYARWDAEISATGFGSMDEDGNDLVYGLGASYAISDKFGVRGEWERFDFDGADVDLLSLGVSLSF